MHRYMVDYSTLVALQQVELRLSGLQTQVLPLFNLVYFTPQQLSRGLITADLIRGVGLCTDRQANPLRCVSEE